MIFPSFLFSQVLLHTGLGIVKSNHGNDPMRKIAIGKGESNKQDYVEIGYMGFNTYLSK